MACCGMPLRIYQAWPTNKAKPPAALTRPHHFSHLSCSGAGGDFAARSVAANILTDQPNARRCADLGAQTAFVAFGFALPPLRAVAPKRLERRASSPSLAKSRLRESVFGLRFPRAVLTSEQQKTETGFQIFAMFWETFSFDPRRKAWSRESGKRFVNSRAERLPAFRWKIRARPGSVDGQMPKKWIFIDSL